MDKELVLVYGAMVVILVLIGFGVYQDQKQWDSFSREHHCVVVGQTAPQSSTGFTSSGKAVYVTSSGTTTYKCDDGVEYTR